MLIDKRTVEKPRCSHLRAVNRKLKDYLELLTWLATFILSAITFPYHLWAMTGQQSSVVRLLITGAPVERELAGGQSHRYQLTLTEGQYVRLVVEQRGIDVVVKIFRPDGEQISEVDSPNGARGPEPVSLIATMTGAYHVDVSSLDMNAKAGLYEAKLVESRMAQPQDKDRIDAHQRFDEAMRLRARGAKESREAAIKKFEEARGIFQALGDRKEEAETLNYLGQLWSSLGQARKALEQYHQALIT